MQPGARPSVLHGMIDDKPPDGATSDRPMNDGIAGTGPGIPDEALGPGQSLPEPPTDEEVAAAARALGAPSPEAEKPGES